MKVTMEELLIHEGELMKKEYNLKKMKGKKNPHVKKLAKQCGCNVCRNEGEDKGMRNYNAGELKQINPKAKQDRPPNFRGSIEPNTKGTVKGDKGKLYLVRCFVCGGERGTENYAGAVATGQCAWCGWKEK